MYSLEFKEINASQIAKNIQEKGYFIFSNALSEPYVNELADAINVNSFLVNNNEIGVVFSENQKFLTHCLAKSKKVYDLITSQKILDICIEYFPSRFQLTNHRICQTFNYSHMPWHTDNNLQIGNQLSGKHNMLGLLFLFYLSDVEDSPFQYIRNSHNWSYQYNEIYFSDSWIENNYQEDILTFKIKKGSLIVCNIHGIHRAKAFQIKNYTRTILVFQVDCVGTENIGHGEQNLINTDFINNFSPELSSYLGFGVRRDYPAFPQTSANNMSLKNILNLQKELLYLFFKTFAKSILKKIMPPYFLLEIKRKFWNLKNNR